MNGKKIIKINSKMENLMNLKKVGKEDLDGEDIIVNIFMKNMKNRTENNNN